MLGFLRFKRISLKKHISKPVLKHAFLLGFFGNAFPFVLMSLSMHYVDSIWMGITNALVPIFVVILSHFNLESENITLNKALGVFVALIGFGLISFDSIEHHNTNQIIGLVISCLASISYAVAITLAKKYHDNIPAITRSSLHVITGTLYLIPLAVIFELPFNTITINLQALLALFVVAVPGTAFAFIYYYKIVNSKGAVVLSMVNYLLPIAKIALGAIILKETLSGNFILSVSLILIGIFLVNTNQAYLCKFSALSKKS